MEPSIADDLYVEVNYDGAAIIVVIDEFDMTGTARFWVSVSEALATQPPSMIVEARGLTFIDSLSLAIGRPLLLETLTDAMTPVRVLLASATLAIAVQRWRRQRHSVTERMTYALRLADSLRHTAGVYAEDQRKKWYESQWSELERPEIRAPTPSHWTREQYRGLLMAELATVIRGGQPRVADLLDPISRKRLTYEHESGIADWAYPPDSPELEKAPFLRKKVRFADESVPEPPSSSLWWRTRVWCLRHDYLWDAPYDDGDWENDQDVAGNDQTIQGIDLSALPWWAEPLVRDAKAEVLRQLADEEDFRQRR